MDSRGIDTSLSLVGRKPSFSRTETQTGPVGPTGSILKKKQQLLLHHLSPSLQTDWEEKGASLTLSFPSHYHNSSIRAPIAAPFVATRSVRRALSFYPNNFMVQVSFRNLCAQVIEHMGMMQVERLLAKRLDLQAE
nr:uncharacterized protein LOC112756998 [Arachis hypogaea]